MTNQWIRSVAVAVLFGAPISLHAQGSALTQSSNPATLDREAQDTRKKELADAILAAREAAARREMSAGLRGSLRAQLTTLSVEALEAFLAAGGLGDIEAALHGPVVPSVITVHVPPSNLGFTPITPCRIIDTRASSAGLMVAGATRDFVVRNRPSFKTQGGVDADCGVPDEATAVELNFVAVGPVAPGDLRAFAFGSTMPTSSVINYSPVPGAGLNLANGIAQPLCNNATTTCTRDFTIFTEAGSTHLVVDVVGYFMKIDGQVRTSIASAQKQSMNAIPTPACSNAGGVSVTIQAVSAGQIIVQGLGTVFLQHAFGTADEVDLFVGSSVTDCPNDLYGQFGFAYLPGPPPSGQYIQSVPLYRVFAVTPGYYTFYLNSRLFGGAANALQHGGLTATFMPQ